MDVEWLSSSSANNPGVKLEGLKNWNSWKFQVKIILKAAEVFEVVDGTIPRPPKPTGEDKDGAQLKAWQRWQRADTKAQGIIVTRLSNAVIMQVQNANTAKEMWDKMCTVYEQKSDVSLHILQQRFFEMKMNKEDMASFLAKIDDIVAQIRQAKGDIPENMIITKIISSVGEKFRHFVSAWDSVPAEKRNLSELTARLLIEEQRNKIYEENSDEQSAFKVNVTDRKCFKCGKPGHYKKNCKVNMNNVNKDKPFCKQCKKRGHTQEQCWFNKNSAKKQVQNDQTSSKQNAFITSSITISALTSKCTVNNNWFLDSGASEHMCMSKDYITNYKQLLVPKDVIIGDGTVIKAIGYGDIELKAFDEENWIPTKIHDVLYVPGLQVNLFSMSAALDKGYKAESTADKCLLMKNNSVHAVAERQGKMFVMKFKTDKGVALVGKCTSGLKEWHAKMAHQNIQQVISILKREDITYEKNSEEETCISCLKGKQHKFPFSPEGHRATKPGEVIHIDIGGPVEEISLGGAKFFLLIKDDYTKYRKVHFLKNKSQSVEYLKQYIKETQRVQGHKIKIVRSDNAKEFLGQDMKKLLNNYGIIHQTSVPYTPEQNGCVEREMRTIVESARTMLLESGLEKNLWAEAINTAIYVINRTGPSRVKDKTPYELWFGETYDIKNLQIFGRKVAVHVPTQRRLKFDSKAEIGYFIGYGENTKGYRVYLPEKKNVEIKRDVVFISEEKSTIVNEKTGNEDMFSEMFTSFDLQKESTNERIEKTDYEDNETFESASEQGSINSFHEESMIQEEIQEVPENILQEEILSDEIPEEIIQEENSRPKRKMKKPKYLKDYVVEDEGKSSNLLTFSCDEPSTYQEAMKRPDRCMWEEAVRKELKTLEENNTWEEVSDIPEGENIVSSRWVFKIKEMDGKPIYKARLVARGFEQKNCDDLTYAPVAKLTTFKLLMAVANQKKLPVYQMDVTGAFLYGDINENVYMKLPEGHKTCKLKKSIYGLKKSPRYWNEKFNNFMLQQNFQKSKNDPCLYVKQSNNDFMYVLIFVDDLLYFGNNTVQVKLFKNALCNNFQMKDLGLAKNYLGINIRQDLEQNVTVINQKKYLEKLLDKYNMSNCKTVATPIEQNFNFDLLQRENPESKEIEKDCRSLIGSLLYSLCTRPDLSVAVGFFSRYVHCASMALYKCLKRILRYVKGSIDLSLIYKANNDVKLQGYSDADWAGDIKDRKSTTGLIFYIFNCPISWGTKKQSCVSLSSCEAEYMALSNTIMEGCFLKKLLVDFGYENILFEISEDNQSVINIAYNNDSNKRLKHVDVKYQFILEKVTSGSVNLKYVSSNNNVADLFTKPLGKQLFLKFRDVILF